MDDKLAEILEVSPPRESPAPSPENAEGGQAIAEKLGGWLWLPAIGIVLGIVISLIGIPMGLMVIPDIFEDSRGIYVLSLFFSTALTGLLVYTGIRFFGRKRNAPALMIALNIASVAVNALLILLYLIAGSEPLFAESLKAFVKSLIAAAIWVPYFLVSRRVKRTFVMP